MACASRKLALAIVGLVHCCSALRLLPTPTLHHGARPLSKPLRMCDGDEVMSEEEAEEARVAAAEKAAKLKRIEAVNKAQASGGSSLLGKLFSLVIVIGVGYFFLGWVFDPSVCEFIPATKPDCMAKLGYDARSGS